MYTIHLHNLIFFSYHGLHEEEKILGGKFEVSLDISSNQIQEVNSIEDSIDYSQVYKVVQMKMKQPTLLLETLASEIAAAIKLMDNRITEISITIKKINPPIENFSGNVGVTLKKIFSS